MILIMMKMILKLYQTFDLHIKFEKRRALKKECNEDLMVVVAWHPRRWQNFCMSEDEKKEHVQCSNDSPVLSLTSQTSQKQNILQTDWPRLFWGHKS